MFKITFNLKSNPCFIDRPVFDSIVFHCFIKDKCGSIPHSSKDIDPNIKLNDDFMTLDEIKKEVPLRLHKDDYFLASSMLFNEKENLEYSENHYKRWNSKDDDLANFGKNKRQISIQAGKFKSYIIPRVLHTINKVWFYFDTDNLKYLEYLIDTYLFGIGKKVSSGHGEIESKTIEIVDFNPFEKEIIRPIPINSIKNNTIETFDLNKVKIVSIRRLPPYHSSINKEKCFVI